MLIILDDICVIQALDFFVERTRCPLTWLSSRRLIKHPKRKKELFELIGNGAVLILVRVMRALTFVSLTDGQVSDAACEMPKLCE